MRSPLFDPVRTIPLKNQSKSIEMHQSILHKQIKVNAFEDNLALIFVDLMKSTKFILCKSCINKYFIIGFALKLKFIYEKDYALIYC